MDQQTEEIIVNELKKYFEENLVSVVLFGAHAVGQVVDNSDIELVIIAKGIPSDFERYSEAVRKVRWAGELSKLPVSIILKEPSNVEGSINIIQPLMLGILRGFKILFDADDFFKTQSDEYRKNMQEWGIEEVSEHGWKTGISTE